MSDDDDFGDFEEAEPQVVQKVEKELAFDTCGRPLNLLPSVGSI